MKKLIMLLILVPFMGASQLEFKQKQEPVKLGEVRIAGTYYGDITHFVEQDVYVIFYKNLKYQAISDVKSHTIGTKEDLNSLYKIIIERLQDKEKSSLEVNYPNGKILRLEFAKKRVQFWVYDNVSWSYSFYFNEKQINQLIGNQ